MTFKIESFVEPRSLRAIDTPFKFGDFIYATNGYICVRQLSAFSSYPENEKMASLINAIVDVPGEWSPLSVTLPEHDPCPQCKRTGKVSVKQCDECMGKGEVDFENGYNRYSFQCGSCDGDGEVYSAASTTNEEICFKCFGSGKFYSLHVRAIPVMGIHVNAKYLNAILELPAIEAFADVSKQMLFFRSGDIMGAVMGMRV